jgi:GxxExxY protein
MADIIYKDESYAIIGACMKVHAELGSGFLEAVYQEALEKEFTKRNIPYKRQQKLTITYEGDTLSKYYIADFFCFDKIILEIKAANFFSDSHYKQLQNYVKATKMKLGLLVNFGTPSLTYKRILNSINSF